MAFATAGAVLLAVLVIGLAQQGGQPTTAQPVVLTADATTCPHKTLVYALCFPDSTAASDGSNRLLRRLLSSGEGGVTQVVKQLSTQFSPPSATSIQFFAQEPDPSPLPPECFQYDGQLNSASLAGNSAVETVRIGNAWAELGVVPFTPAGASQASKEFSGGLVNLSSCADLGLSGSGWSVLNASTGGTAGMDELVLRDIGAIPPAYTGNGVIVQYSEFEVIGDSYIYVTAFSRPVADQLAAALAAKQ